MSRVYFVRHAVHGLIGKELAGRKPGVHLSEPGRDEAMRLVRHFESKSMAAIVASPLERCRETAQPIAGRLGLPVEIDEALNEIDCGDWTGVSFASLDDDPRWHSWNSERGRSGIPGGETVRDVQTRVKGVLTRLGEHDRGPVMLVSHSDVIKVAVLTLLGGALDWHDRIEIAPASITTLDLWPGGGKVVRLNEEAAR